MPRQRALSLHFIIFGARTALSMQGPPRCDNLLGVSSQTQFSLAEFLVMPKAYLGVCYRSISDPQKLAAYAKLAPGRDY